MSHFKLTIAYDGSGYVGWQRQASGMSIQGLLEAALAELDGRDVAVMGAGRTDAGVHALGQVASICLHRDIDGASVVRALNTRLPESVRVLDAVEADPQFHARFNARSKTYRYRIWNQSVMNPFERAYAWHVLPPPLDVAAMADAARLLEGHHDFAAFQGTGTDPHSTERTIFASRFCTVGEAGITLSDPAGTFSEAAGTVDEAAPSAKPQNDRRRRSTSVITYEICGDGFLRHMVRTIAGTLVEVGRGRYPSAWIADVLASRDRTRAGRTAPPEGLFLVKVDY